MAGTKTQDNHPAIMIKPAILGRSGVYWYTYDEMVQRGYTPEEKKPLYSEYRSPAVVLQSRDKYPFSAMTVEHTQEETNAGNFRKQVSGIVGEVIDVETLDDGEIALRGKLAFYTQDAVDYYNAGNKETSGDLRTKVARSKDSRYDFVCLEILSVNGVVLTERGRGGPSVRVMDSVATGNKNNGGMKMKHGVLSTLFGIGRAKDKAEFKLSQVVMDGVKQMHTLDGPGIDKMVAGVMGHINPLSDRDDKEILVGAVTDSFKHPVEVIAKEKELSEVIDKLYTRCRDADEADLKKTMDAMDEETDEQKAEKKKKLEEAEKPDGNTKDSGKLVEEAMAKATAEFKTEMKRVTDSIPSLVDAAMAKALNPKSGGEGGGGGQDDKRVLDGLGSLGSEDGSFLLNDIFGNR